MIWLSISCLSMKMTLRNVCVELWLKLRLGFITLILKSKSRVCNGSTLAQPLPFFFFSREKLMTSTFWGSQGVIVLDYLEEGCTITSAYYTKRSGFCVKRLWRKEEESWLEVFCSCKIMHQLIFPRLLWLLRLNAASRSLLIPRILQI